LIGYRVLFLFSTCILLCSRWFGSNTFV